MPIPAFSAEGLLPEGIHDCTLSEVKDRFGQFQQSDRRCRLFETLELFAQDTVTSGLVTAIIVDGSFVTAKDNPEDIDIILVVGRNHDFRAELLPRDYNLLSRRDARRKYGFDVLVARSGRAEPHEYVDFFMQVRRREDLRKGLLRITP